MRFDPGIVAQAAKLGLASDVDRRLAADDGGAVEFECGLIDQVVKPRLSVQSVMNGKELVQRGSKWSLCRSNVSFDCYDAVAAADLFVRLALSSMAMRKILTRVVPADVAGGGSRYRREKGNSGVDARRACGWLLDDTRLWMRLRWRQRALGRATAKERDDECDGEEGKMRFRFSIGGEYLKAR